MDFKIGFQPCQIFQPQMEIGMEGGAYMNLHQCPRCERMSRSFCEKCLKDHHDGGWEICKGA